MQSLDCFNYLCSIQSGTFRIGKIKTHNFIMALRQFLARRSRVSTVYTDNCSNFVGASNVFTVLKSSNIQYKANQIKLLPVGGENGGRLWSD